MDKTKAEIAYTEAYHAYDAAREAYRAGRMDTDEFVAIREAFMKARAAVNAETDAKAWWAIPTG